MKKTLFLVLLAASALLPAQASLYTVGNVNGSGTSLNQTINDANPSGITSSLLVSGAGSSLSSVTVTLNVAGGYNGDLYAYLLDPSGTLTVLLNRVGTSVTSTGNPIQDASGYATSGFNNVTLSDGGAGGNIHNVSNPGTGGIAYALDGGSLASFNGSNPNGTWTLFFADMSGGNVSTLNGWSLDITAVPEPVTLALVVFLTILLAFSGLRWMWKKLGTNLPGHLPV